MSELLFPQSCQFCSKPFYGPVQYCPFCGKKQEVDHQPQELPLQPPPQDTQETQPITQEPPESPSDTSYIEQANKELEQAQEIRAKEVFDIALELVRDHQSNLTEKLQGNEEWENLQKEQQDDFLFSSSISFLEQMLEQNKIVADDKKEEFIKKVLGELAKISPALPPQEPASINPPPSEPSQTSPIIHSGTKSKSILGKILLLILVFLMVGGGGYYVFTHSRGGGKNPPPHGDDPKKEIARVLATETISQGVVLSKAINRVPKIEITLQAAKKLTNISPRYLEQEKKAETALLAAKDNRDKSLMAYMGKLLELTRYSQEDMAYGIDIVRNGNLTTREQKVMDLLEHHAKIMKENPNVEPEKILRDFSEQFNNFVD